MCEVFAVAYPPFSEGGLIHFLNTYALYCLHYSIKWSFLSNDEIRNWGRSWVRVRSSLFAVVMMTRVTSCIFSYFLIIN